MTPGGGRNSGRQELHDVAVIGAGAVGATIALELARRGRSVTILESGEGWAAGCSRANAGLICPSHAAHFASRRDLANVARWLLRSDSPFGVRPRPSLIPFSLRLLSATRSRPWLATRLLLTQLARRSLSLHVDLARDIGTGVAHRGLLDVYQTRAGFEQGRSLAGVGPGQEEPIAIVLSAREAKQLEPGIECEIAGAVLHSGDADCDPLRYVSAVGAAAMAAGAIPLTGTRVSRIDTAGGVCVLRTTRGDLRARTVICAMGAGSSRPLAFRRRLQLQAGIGYSVDLGGPAAFALERPAMLQEARVAITPLRGRLRLAGTLHLRGLDTTIDSARIRGIRDAVGAAVPVSRKGEVLSTWAGARPCTPDGLPLVGWLSRAPAVAVATGHAMLGLTLAPVTAELVVDLLEHRSNPHLHALRPDRF